MRIGITLQSLDPTWGGIGVYTEEIVDHLLKLGQNHEFVLIYPGFADARKRLGTYRGAYPNVTEIETPRPWLTTCSYWDQITVPRTVSKLDLDLLFNPFWSTPFVGKFKKVIVVHNVEKGGSYRFYRLKSKINWFMHDKLLMRSADQIIAISDMMAHRLTADYGVPAHRIRQIYHGVGTKFRQVEDVRQLTLVRGQYHLPDDFMLFVGNIYPQKNFAVVLHAMHQNPGRLPALVVAGRPRWRFDEDLALVDRLGLKERVHFLGFVPHDEMPTLYSLARCFIFPSFYEQFGLAGVEAMACGCPVIAARAAALPEILGDGAMFFDPYDPGALAAAVLRLESDPAARQVLIDKGLVRAYRFSWDRCALETLKMFEELVAHE